MATIEELKLQIQMRKEDIDPKEQYKRIWYLRNKARLRKFESTELFKSYRNLRIFIQKRKNKLAPEDLIVLQQIKDKLKNVIQEENIKSRFQFQLNKKLEERRRNTGK